ncbi:MAG TPA: glycoside hydrolase family 20 zincin-like fold domain-containing protein, partial [Sphaerochaeta sp.]|nr:glycoside hydrolase family 20 zincin-like fold domain-containing protein [Sphaerochaeta sp.]
MYDNLMLIPYPNGKMVQSSEFFVLGNSPSIEKAEDMFAFASNQLITWLTEKCHMTPTISNSGQPSSIKFRKSDEPLPEEGYVLHISSEGCVLEASSAAGGFYAFQTFKQLIDPK